MPELKYAIRVAVIKDVIAHAKTVGAYHTYDWLETHLKLLETQENERIRERSNISANKDS